MKRERITITLQTLSWTMGDFAYFDILQERGTTANIDWGDNHSFNVAGNGDWTRCEHRYIRRETPYTITIEAQNSGAILGLRHWSIDMKTLDVDITKCVSIKYLTAHNLSNIDLANNPNILELDLAGYKGEFLDLRSNTLLESLDIRYSNNKKICLNNGSQLKHLDISETTHLTPLSLKFILEVVEKNKK